MSLAQLHDDLLEKSPASFALAALQPFDSVARQVQAMADPRAYVETCLGMIPADVLDMSQTMISLDTLKPQGLELESSLVLSDVIREGTMQSLSTSFASIVTEAS